MPKNLEFKVAVPALTSAVGVCRRLRARRIGTLRQIDTYFAVKKGRLKLREINGKKFELIYYSRSTAKGSRYSDYVIVPLKDPDVIKALCGSLFGIKTTVRKNRALFLYRNARIHLDVVRGLGTFIELEVIVTRGKRQARRLMDFLILEFGLSARSSVAGSYADLMQRH
jgi:adenylate cyclase, class 2